MTFEPDYRHVDAVLRNRRPARLPFYEHIICTEMMERIGGHSFAELERGGPAELDEFFRHYAAFWRDMGYDTVSYEVCLGDLLPGHGAILGGMKGPIQSRADFDAYPWDDLPRIYWETAAPRLDALCRQLPAGMKAIGGVGHGVFELSEDLVGLEYLAYMQADDPELHADVYRRIGDVMVTVWSRFLDRYAESFVACRFGDDLGFKTSLLTTPGVVRERVIPQYRRVIGRIRDHGSHFLWHSCGCIFEIMEDVIALGIAAKHSNEDAIAPYERWIESYGDRIGLFGGIDVDVLCSRSAADVFDTVLERATRYRSLARAWALGSGNSIPDYVPAEGYLAMLRAGEELRRREATGQALSGNGSGG